MSSLRIQTVSVVTGGRTLLDGVDLVLHPGELCALLGPSGAGKSTLMKAILGLRKPSSGVVQFGTAAVGADAPVGYVPQDDALHGVLTVRAALSYAARLRLWDVPLAEREARLDDVVARVGLHDRLDVRIDRLSGGQRKRVSVAMELLTAPPILVLDEPTSGLDPGMEARTMGLFRDLAHEGRVVLVSTHAMASMDQCDVVVVLVGGRTAYAGPPGACAGWFGALDLNGVFPAIARRAPPVWARTWEASPERAAFLGRAAPSTNRAAPVLHDAPPEGQGPPSRPTPAEQLAALKAQRGTTP